MKRLAIVGSGPMALYTLKHLQDSRAALEVDVLESAGVAGVGSPYRPGLNSDDMLCNAFSREIPYASKPLFDWLEGQPARELSAWELSSHDLSPRAFYPRVLIGEYLRSEFGAAVGALCAQGHRVTVSTGHRVTDIVPEGRGFTVRGLADGAARDVRCDDIILATGHAWPEAPELGGVKLVSPWPYTNVTVLPPGDIGVLGSSLSAIDVVVALASEHGTFEESGEAVAWAPKAGREGLKVTMVSHRGVMPEGDFYYPFPYEPLKHITEGAVLAEVGAGPEELLERVFGLLLQELDHADPAYLAELGLRARSLTGFADAYFARRAQLGGLRAVQRDLVETRRSMREKKTVPHRYALLRGHEAFGHALAHLSGGDYTVFEEYLLPVFADCYAAVPHLSLARVVALHEAGVLELRATASGAAFRRSRDGRIEVATADGAVFFHHVVDARGQAAHPVSALPFPTLVAALGDAEAAVDAPFRLELKRPGGGRVYCLAMPQLLERHPFSQGLPSCDELAGVVVGDLLAPTPVQDS